MTKQKLSAFLEKDLVLLEDSDDARNLYYQNCYGELVENRVILPLIEALYLLEKKKIEIYKTKKKKITFDELTKRALKIEPNFWTRYCVFRDFRSRGYIIKTALKFGADFRVYSRGVKPGQDHAKWVVFPVKEGTTFTWHEFSAKNRVAHSTKKKLVIGVVDYEGDVTYYEIKWLKP